MLDNHFSLKDFLIAEQEVIGQNKWTSHIKKQPIKKQTNQQPQRPQQTSNHAIRSLQNQKSRLYKQKQRLDKQINNIDKQISQRQ